MSDYAARCSAAGAPALPAIVDCLKGKSTVACIAGNVLATKKALRGRRVEDTDFTLLCSALGSKSSLRGLDCGYNVISDAGFTSTLPLLGSVAITSWDVRENKMTGKGAFALFTHPSVADHARSINVSGNPIGDAGAMAAASLLRQSSQLSELYLSRCRIGIDGLIALCAAVPASSTLRVLDVSEAHLESRNEEVSGHLADMLRSSTRLSTLVLRKVPHLSYRGVAALIDAILANDTCKELDLTGNRLGPPAALHIATAMAKGLALKVLRISSCGLGDEGAVALSRVLAGGLGHLEELDIRQNGIGDEGIEAVAKAIMSPHCTLKTLHVWGNPGLVLIPGGRPGIEAMAHACDLHATPDKPRRTTIDVHAYRVDGVAHVACV